MDRYLNFTTDGLKSVEFILHGLKRPMAIAVYSDTDEDAVQAIASKLPMTENQVATYCRQHKLRYRFMPIS